MDRGLGPSDVCRVLVHAVARVLPVTLVVWMEAVLPAALKLTQAGRVRMRKSKDAVSGRA